MKGYHQHQGVDYKDTFFPVAMLISIKVMLAVAAHYDYDIWQIDVKTTFLKAYLMEDIVMK